MGDEIYHHRYRFYYENDSALSASSLADLAVGFYQARHDLADSKHRESRREGPLGRGRLYVERTDQRGQAIGMRLVPQRIAGSFAMLLNAEREHLWARKTGDLAKAAVGARLFLGKSLDHVIGMAAEAITDESECDQTDFGFERAHDAQQLTGDPLSFARAKMRQAFRDRPDRVWCEPPPVVCWTSYRFECGGKTRYAALVKEDVAKAICELATIAERANAVASLVVAHAEEGHEAVFMRASEDDINELVGHIVDRDQAASETTPFTPSSVDTHHPMTTLSPSPKESTLTAKNDDLSPPNTSIVKTLQHDASEAAWRTAGSQFVKLTREPLVGLLSRHLGPDDDALRGRIATFLETEIGTALLASLLSVGLAAVPGVAGQVPQRLAHELRVRAMSDAGDVVADVLMGPLRQVMTMYLQDASPAITVAPAAALGPAAPKFPRPVEASDKVKSEIG